MPTTWLITGSSRGLGFEFVRQLAEESDNTVFATCRNPSGASALQALAKEKSTHAKIHIFALDTDDEQSVQGAARETAGLLGDGRGIDYLLNNAAIGSTNSSKAHDLDPEEFLTKMRANVIGPARVVKYFLPLVERSTRKVLLNMSSGLGSIGFDLGPSEPSYSMSKAALNMYTYKLKAEKPECIFISMDPGWVKTDMGGKNADLEPEVSISGMRKVLLGLSAMDSGSYLRWDGKKMPW